MHGPGIGSAPITLETLGGLVTLASPNSIPEGGSPRNWDCDFIIGDVKTRDHQVSYYSFGNSFIGPNPGSVATATGTGNAWNNPGGILIDDATPAYIAASGGTSNYLNVTGFAFNLPEAASVTGITIVITGYATAPSNLLVGLLINGTPTGNAKSVTIGPSTTSITLGGPTDQWGDSFNSDIINSAEFGFYVIASSNLPLAQILLNYGTMQIYQTLTSANFNFVGTFQNAQGTIFNIALDANGTLWIENATTAPGVLTLLEEGLTPGSYAVGQTTENAEFLAISGLTAGSDVPRQYNSQGWIDRVSQVGPGAAPVFAATTSTGSTPASVTSWAASGGIITFQASNNFTAGEVISLSTFTTTTAFNGGVFNVLGTGLTTSQFEIENPSITGSGTEAGLATAQYTYPIAPSAAGITQPAATAITFGGILWSAAPGSTTPGTTITFYYQDSTVDEVPFYGQPDPTLVNLFNSGQPVYVFISGSPVGNGTWQVTSVGIGTQPQESRQYYYFTIQVPQTEYANYKGQSGYGFTYEITMATLTTLVPVPNLTTGQQFTISGASPSNWNNLWTITQALNSSVMTITETVMVGGVATYSYDLVGGSTAPPAVGELVTVTNTLNGGGIFNVIDYPIAAVTGSNKGTFTLTGFPTSDSFSSQVEAGQAQTAGTQFNFDPGAAVAGTQSNPIYGNGGGGVVSLASSAGQVISPGTKQGVVGFITRNGYETTPSPPVQFDVPENSNYIEATLIPVGPPNTVARYIAFTESGQNGVPGGNFFTIPTQVQFIVNGVTYTSSALVINDNVTTSARFTFSDSVLLNATAIDVEGNNLFNLIEIGNPGWLIKYADRMVYGLCQNKVQNFLNLSFDGGYIPGTNPSPLGWGVDPVIGVGGTLLNSAIFGNSYYIQNAGSGTATYLGLITQPAFQDYYQVPIINIQTLYSIRVCARCPSGGTVGTLIVDLVDSNIGTGYGSVYGTFSIPFASLTTSFQILTGTFLNSKFETVPSDLVLRIYAQGVGAGGDVEIDRIEIFPTEIPVLNTQVFMSYVENYESVDAVTGVVGVSAENEQPCNGAQVMDNILYLLKESSWYETQDTPNTEPAYWNTARNVSETVGSCGPLASDEGEGWIATACRKGLFVFTGGQPVMISMDIYQVWNAINWEAGQTIWVKNDVKARKLYVGVPLPTPNFWLPNAAANPAPTSPNVVLYLNYWGISSGEELKDGMQVHATMFGNLMAPDMKRKWSIWNIACPFADFIRRFELDNTLMMGNGINSSKLYTLEPTVTGVVPTDDGAPINSLYTTYSWNGSQKVRANPLMGAGRIRWGYMTMLISGTGNLAVRLLPNTLLGPGDSTFGYYPWTIPGGFNLTDPCLNDRESPLNFPAFRSWMELSITAGYFQLSNISMFGKKDVFNQVRGIK